MKRLINLPKGRVILLYRDLVTLGIDVSKSTLYRWMDAGEFPAPLHLGGTRQAWLASEIGAWLSKLAAERTTRQQVKARR